MHEGIRTTMSPVEWALLLLLSVIWGGSFFFNKIALADLPTLTIVFGRVSLGGIILIIMVYALGRSLPRSPGLWLSFFLMGALNNMIPFCLIVWGQNRIGSGLASILNAATPVFTVLLAHCLTRDERLTGKKMLGVCLGLAGVAVLIGPEALRGLGMNLAAQLAVLGAGFSYALAGIFGRRFRHLPPLVTAAGQVASGALLLLPLTLWADRPWTLPVPGPAALGSVLCLAVICTAGAYLIYFRILASAGATNILLVTLLIPVSASFLGAVFLGEVLSCQHAAGMGLIALGLAAIDGRLMIWLRKRVIR